MPTDPLLPEGRQFPRTRSPDGSGGNERKRRRKVLSCYDCRRRKLQCDRALPSCGRCTKAGQAANCLYIEDATEIPIREEPSMPGSGKLSPYYGHSSRPIGLTAPAGDPLSRLEYQDGRIKQLEAALARTSRGTVAKAHLPMTPESLVGGIGAVDTFAPVQDRETTLLRGGNFKTQFHGNTHPGALIARIPELQGFTRETFEQFPALSKIKEDMGILNMKRDITDGPRGPITDQVLLEMLPEKTETDRLLELYLENYGNLYNVLHLPSFKTEYEDIWSEGTQNAKPFFVALLLAMLSAAQCLPASAPRLYNGSGSVPRERSIEWIAALDAWLMNKSQKHVAAVDFQLRVVLLIAKNAAARKFKRTWTECGSVLRFCMAAGLHRAPDLIRKPTSVLNKELRKRVWAAATELELQAAFDRGMVSNPWSLQSDCPGPVHVHDDDIDQDTQHLPALRKAHDFTPVSYLCLASESHKLRATLNTYLNNIRQPVSFEDSKRFTDEIEYHLQNIPDWSSGPPNSIVAKAMLEINLRQYILVLHDRQLRSAETKGERDFSRMILIDTASKMVRTHQSLISKGYYGLEILCHDQLRAGISLCHISASNPRADDVLSRIIDETAAQLVPQCCEMLTDKAIRFGRELRQVWILLVAHAYVKARKEPEGKLKFMQEAVEKIARPYYKIMACQVDESGSAGGSGGIRTARRGLEEQEQKQSEADGKGTDQNRDTMEYYSGGEVLDASAVSGDAVGFMDMDDIAAWTFEDWSFDSADLAAMNVAGQFGANVAGEW